ncbi:odorant receptor Or1-like [Leptopilina heterotoma]|uniref:odorant receptor Or1-like n=1 Tax=Leptopilina heterotoma TaxID=63436 RepID=UPI001CA898AE|nr:odorant receptor Or1-like [Leptopilina heterotoma]
MFLTEICQPRDNNEIAIIKEFSRIGRRNTILFFVLVHFNGCVSYSIPLASKNVTTLPLPAWFPYSLQDSSLVFIFSYVYQTIGIIMTITISVGMDSLALTTILQICGQIEIIMHRFNLLSEVSHENNDNIKISDGSYNDKETELTKHCIKHLLFIYSLAKNLNKQFGLVIFLQFFASMFNLCAIIFNLSKVSLGSQVGCIMIFAVATYVLQIYFYCFYGDQITEKSLEIAQTIYFLNWEALKIKTKKTLIIIMIRSSRPIQLTGASIVTMSIDTFMKVVKSTYSAYNLLKNTSQ